jgi:catechol 2,3-dioxygenase-like lactoylglutathione lyase family enzyme
MAATNLNHVSLIARDLEESVRFYLEVFGMERIPTPNFGFPVHWLRVGPLQLHLFGCVRTRQISRDCASCANTSYTHRSAIQSEGDDSPVLGFYCL